MGLIVNRERLLAEYPTCYACDEKRGSAEHVPPKCFFPDERDENGKLLYRKQLIKVPACDVHNLRKSKDDFYAAFHLTSTMRGNHCANLVRDGMIKRAIERDQQERGGAFTRRVLAQVKGKVGNNYYGELDPERMARVLELCARGLYFAETTKKLLLPLRVANLDFDLPDPAHAARLAEMRKSFAREMRGCEYKSANPDVFQYAICEKPEQNIIIVEMVFYGDQHRWAFYHPDAERQVF